MFYKVIIMEIKNNYCIALCDDGRMLKIKTKNGLSVGDKILVLEQDIIKEDKVVIPHYSFAKKVAGVLALLIMCLCLYQIRPLNAYAMVSIDGKNNLELKLDKNGVIKEVNSTDLNDEDLQSLPGKNIKELTLDGAKFVAIAPLQNDISNEFKEEIYDLFDEETLFFVANSDDLKQAQNENSSLSIYLIEKAIKEDKLEDVLEDKTASELYEIIKSEPELLDNEEIIEILEEQVEEEKEAEEDKLEDSKEDAEDIKESTQDNQNS